jgi:metal-responsive CopG/Arc/MetJ family transcriptional regulator
MEYFNCQSKVVSISLSGTELKEFDNITNKMGFSSRSDAVREALHRFVAQNKWINLKIL